MPKYAIVEFSAENDIAVVAASWIYEENDKTFCHCPPLWQMSRAAEKCLAVQPSWKAYECREIYSTGIVCSNIYLILKSFTEHYTL